MNRTEKRNLAKRIKKVNKEFNLGLDKTQIESYVKFKEMQTTQPLLSEGDKVKIDYTVIVSQPDYNKRRTEYKKFIEENKDKIFTVK